jgi:hypothetical protein
MVGVDALSRYYNCTTRVANKNGTLSLQNIKKCYDQIFKGAKQAEKDETEAIKTTSFAMSVIYCLSIFLSILY